MGDFFRTSATTSLEECPDLEGIETSCVTLCLDLIRLEECPDLEGIET